MSAALALFTQEHNEEGHAWPAGERKKKKKERLEFEALLAGSLQEADSLLHVVLQAEVNE